MIEKLKAMANGMDDATAVMVRTVCTRLEMALAEKEVSQKRMLRLEWENSALIRALAAADLDCNYCLHNTSPAGCETADFVCAECKALCPCKDCRDNKNWRWKGVDADGR